MTRLGIQDVAGLVRYAIRAGLISLEEGRPMRRQSPVDSVPISPPEK
jgi:hypothetical protein